MEATGGGGDLLDVCGLGSTSAADESVVAAPGLPGGVKRLLRLIEDSLPSLW